jgi:hypothetical protein
MLRPEINYLCLCLCLCLRTDTFIFPHFFLQVDFISYFFVLISCVLVPDPDPDKIGSGFNRESLDPYQDPDSRSGSGSITLKRIRIQFFTLRGIRILLLRCESATAGLEPLLLNCERPRPVTAFQPLKLLNFDINVDPDLAFSL